MVQTAFCDLLHTFHKQVTNVSQHVFVILLWAGFPLKLYFKIPCVFPVQSQMFPVPICIICDYYINETDLADLFNSWRKNGNFRGKYRNILYF